MRRLALSWLIGVVMGAAAIVGMSASAPRECIAFSSGAGETVSAQLARGWTPDQPMTAAGIYCGRRTLLRWP